MEANQSILLSEKIVHKIWLEKKHYNEAMRSNKEFAEVKKILLKINKLRKQLWELVNMSEVQLYEFC